MAEFHFVEDYEKYVARLVREYPLDEAMAHAVGGHYELFGAIEAGLLRALGLKDGMHLVDLGCGSGRLASALHASMKITYFGTDIVQQLLDYAKTRAPSYEFRRHRELGIPQRDGCADFVTAFSLFTHLLQAETYVYLEEAVRVLKPGGCIVFSFLEFAEPYHWATFIHTRDTVKARTADHLNMFIERPSIEAWAGHLGVAVERYVDATTALGSENALGQSVVLLRKPG
jgi:2-polyprenyl-3-methyl-5-hydroxy-6-metoxy-1,4-benzoquinol methylase